MNSQAVVEALDEGTREWRVKGMNGSLEARAEFLKSCFHAARFNMRIALLATPILRPGETPHEVFDEMVPKIIASVEEQGRNSGYTDEQVKLYVDVHERAYRSLAGEFGFVKLTHDEIEALKAI